MRSATCPVPTIADVNGHAAGAGAYLALAADMVIGTESTYFFAGIYPHWPDT